ncbi:helix-turn-helix domain-containing protein, partial [Ruminococcaceae bacterium OttesenSCG-928-D13]|nr:helix-turn-helix domain-containing protein [Ruminococcaceae bacterium OttesenSCG-928-D13]
MDREKVKKEFGERVRLLRNENEWNQEELASKIELSVSALSDIELGKHLARTETVYALCEVLETSADYLLGLKEYTPANHLAALLDGMDAKEIEFAED